MTTTGMAHAKAFGVWFKDLERWSVGSFINLDWNWPASDIRPLSDVLDRKLIAVDNMVKPEDIRLVTLHFDGEMEARKQNGPFSIKGRLWWADPGDVVYSKIDVRNGAIGIVPLSLGRVCVTSEYPIYAVNSSLADARYIKLLFRTQAFRRKINGMISGASGRKRVQPEELEGIAVPLPALSMQRAVAAFWERTQAEIAYTRRRIAELEDRIEADFLTALGIAQPRQMATRKAFALWWRELERWSVTFNRLAGGGVDIRSGLYPVTTLGEIAAVSYGIQKSPANRPGAHARPYLRVANVQRGELNLREIKAINVPDAEMASFRLEIGDLLVCEGNSADLVGRPAMWRGEISDCVHQNHILKVRINQVMALPQFVLEYMQTIPARNYFRVNAKFTTNLASINSKDLRELPLPLPPLDVQHKLVERLSAQRQAIATLRADAERQTEHARADVEAMILGEKAIP